MLAHLYVFNNNYDTNVGEREQREEVRASGPFIVAYEEDYTT